ncbi:alpha/beta hydrolase family protein [Parapedobacter sp. DT-150]|uniref:alpha/beta hydrolase family protein n=1 Tax=Parapedobacter sp. DT-150 TaxID=3396162 RepID=UPI003F1D1B43
MNINAVILFSLGTLFSPPSIYAQKPPIDLEAYDSWESLEYGEKISADGKFVCYSIKNRPVGGKTLCLRSINLDWELDVPGVSAFEMQFTGDSKTAVFIKSDTLCLLALGTSGNIHIPSVKSFSLQLFGQDEYLVYASNTSENLLVLKNLRTKEELRFSDIKSHWINDRGSTVALLKESEQARQVLQLVEIKRKQPVPIWEGRGVTNMVFSQSGDQLVFMAEKPATELAGKAIWHYAMGNSRATLLVDDGSAGVDSDLQLGRIRQFSSDDTRLFIDLNEGPLAKAGNDAIMVDVWNYLDPKLQHTQLADLGPKSYLAMLQIEDKAIFRLQQENEFAMFSSASNDSYVINSSTNGGGDISEDYWNTAAMRKAYLVNTKNSSRKEIEVGSVLSPTGKRLVYFDKSSNHYMSRSLSDDKVIIISKFIPEELTTSFNSRFGSETFGIAGWIKGSEKVLIYDEYDIWLVDLKTETAPINLTNSYGRKNRIMLRLMINPYGDKIIPEKGEVLLTGYSRETKENGFYEITMGKKGDPVCLTSGLYTYYARQKERAPNDGFLPQKAKNAGAYLVRRESATESPNFFVTTDFKTFTKVSNVAPEKNYNWLTVELHKWTSPDGKELQGVLYKPEDFDPSKKYPVIFHYYEIMSDRLTSYQPPTTSGNGLNIPSVVSNGYLVFTPDILYTIGDPMQSIYSSVVSAANYLSGMPFVDSTKMGLQGISWGAIQTNGLVTHSNLFSAACAASGASDYISHFGAISHGSGGQSKFERGQHRLGANLWERPEWFVNASPVMNAHKVTTPILLMNNKKDTAVPFEQGVEFFTSLRRLGKRVWMLQYDEGDHGVSGELGKDFTIRMMQFFDHYLKGKPAPKWMTRGIPAKLKGIETGLELDNEIKTPPEGGLLIPEEKRKVDSLMQRKPITITID